MVYSISQRNFSDMTWLGNGNGLYSNCYFKLEELKSGLTVWSNDDINNF